MESISNPAREAARARLAAAEAKREDILLYHIANGVNIESRTVEIDEGVVIAPGATILSGTILRGKTVSRFRIPQVTRSARDFGQIFAGSRSARKR